MATPNYGYEKRQKELAKKQKKAEKLKEKSERKANGSLDDAGVSDSSEFDSAQQPPTDAS